MARVVDKNFTSPENPVTSRLARSHPAATSTFMFVILFMSMSITAGNRGLRRFKLLGLKVFTIRDLVKSDSKESTMSSTADSPSAGEGASDPRAATAKTVMALDADGDLILRAGTTSFKVCSATLRRASPVWKAMLFGPWKESRPTTDGQEWVVTLSEDSPSALKIVLAIVHGKFDRVPQHMDVTPFSEVLLVAHKYDVSGVMGPWMKQWAEGIDWCEISQRRNHSLIRAAYIAWDLGLEDRLMMITRTLIVEAPKPILEGLFGGTLFPGPPDFRGKIQ
jgi:hypothetical protein